MECIRTTQQADPLATTVRFEEAILEFCDPYEDALGPHLRTLWAATDEEVVKITSQLHYPESICTRNISTKSDFDKIGSYNAFKIGQLSRPLEILVRKITNVTKSRWCPHRDDLLYAKTNYEQFIETLRLSKGEERLALLRGPARLFGLEKVWCVDQKVARKMASVDAFNNHLRTNANGEGCVAKEGEVFFKTERINELQPGNEHAVNAFCRRLFKVGTTASSLLKLINIWVLDFTGASLQIRRICMEQLKEGLTPEKILSKEAVKNCPLQPKRVEWVLQASLEVKGSNLHDHLQGNNPGNLNPYTASVHACLALLLRRRDDRADNFIVEDDSNHLIGIDNEERRKSHIPIILPYFAIAETYRSLLKLQSAVSAGVTGRWQLFTALYPPVAELYKRIRQAASTPLEAERIVFNEPWDLVKPDDELYQRLIAFTPAAPDKKPLSPPELLVRWLANLQLAELAPDRARTILLRVRAEFLGCEKLIFRAPHQEYHDEMSAFDQLQTIHFIDAPYLSHHELKGLLRSMKPGGKIVLNRSLFLPAIEIADTYKYAHARDCSVEIVAPYPHLLPLNSTEDLAHLDQAQHVKVSSHFASDLRLIRELSTRPLSGLDCLDFSDTKLSDAGLAILCDAMLFNPVWLNLKGCWLLTADARRHLAESYTAAMQRGSVGAQYCFALRYCAGAEKRLVGEPSPTDLAEGDASSTLGNTLPEKLTYLNISNDKRFKDETFRRLLNALPNLRYLDVRHCTALTNRAFAYLAEHLPPDLIELHISGDRVKDFPDLEKTFAPYLPNLDPELS